MIPAAITDEFTQEFERALDAMAECGVRVAELRGLWGTNVMDLSAEERARAAEERSADLERQLQEAQAEIARLKGGG